MKYYMLCNDRELDDGVVIDNAPVNGPDEYLYSEVISLAKRFPSSAKLRFSKNYPDNIKVYDFIDNICRLLIVSEKTIDVINQYQKDNIEFLPVVIIEHNNSVAPCGTYYILNTFVNVDYRYGEV